MDTKIQELLDKVKSANRTPFWQSTPQVARSGATLMDLLFGEAPAVARIEDFTIPSSSGFALPVRLYVPGERCDQLIVFLHGGGWVIGSVASYHPFTAALASTTGCAVLSVDYRLSPEHPYPAALDDACAALAWAASDGAARVGCERLQRLAVMGDSAGGNLATVASRLHNQARVLRAVDYQVLAYPVTDHVFDTGSYLEFAEGNLLTRKDMIWFWDHYCADPALRSDPHLSPLRTPDLSGSPAAFVLTAGRDPLRDEGEAYSRRLVDAGVHCELKRYDSLVHGFLAMVNYAPQAQDAFQDIKAFIGKPADFR